VGSGVYRGPGPRRVERFRPGVGDGQLPPSGAHGRARANLAVIGLLQRLAEQERDATDTERAQLARWSGWGAVAELFDEQRQEWQRDRAQLRALVGEDGYAQARRTTINAHYTHPAIAAAMWQLAGELGFAGGEVIEPGCGAGVFIGLAPEDASVMGVELDGTTAQVAEQLYPHAKIVNRSFAEPARGLREGRFALAIGNVPFGKVTLYDPQHNRSGHAIHNHFIVKSSGSRGSISFRSRPSSWSAVSISATTRPSSARHASAVASRSSASRCKSSDCSPARASRRSLPSSGRSTVTANDARAGCHCSSGSSRLEGSAWRRLPGTHRRPDRRCGAQLVGGAQLIRATIEPAAAAVDDVRAPRVIDEAARGEAGKPAPLVARELTNHPQPGEQLVLIDAAGAHLDVCDHACQQLAAGGAAIADQEIQVPSVLRTGDAAGAIEILTQPSDPDPPFNQPEHVNTGVVRFEHDLGRDR
jgi:predicted RNA methylase